MTKLMADLRILARCALSGYSAKAPRSMEDWRKEFISEYRS
jgi:hypothetical protein